MPVDYSNYPANWMSEIRPAILSRAGLRCECLGADCDHEGRCGEVHGADGASRSDDSMGRLEALHLRSATQSGQVVGNLCQEHIENLALQHTIAAGLLRQQADIQHSGGCSATPVHGPNHGMRKEFRHHK